MITIRPAEQRGRADFGWLQSRHSFSFGEYYDQEHMGFSALRVINDDRVTPGAGFPTHGHRDMEILSYVVQGAIAHKDSENHEELLPAGEFQLMSAGSGIRHSEYNASATEPLHFLQIWIQPNVYGVPPRYQQKDFGQHPGLTLIASPDGQDGQDGSLSLRQDARIYQLRLAANSSAELAIGANRNAYVHIIEGELKLAEHRLQAGDGAKLTNPEGVQMVAGKPGVAALVFDLP